MDYLIFIGIGGKNIEKSSKIQRYAWQMWQKKKIKIKSMVGILDTDA